MPTLTLPTFDGTGDVRKFLDKFYRFSKAQGINELQMLGLVFAHLSGSATDWFADDMVDAPLANWAEIQDIFPSRFGTGYIPIKAATVLSTLKIRKGQRISDHIHRVVKLCKDLDPRTSDVDQKHWLANSLSRE